jgi:hypothetical protein
VTALEHIEIWSHRAVQGLYRAVKSYYGNDLGLKQAENTKNRVFCPMGGGEKAAGGCRSPRREAFAGDLALREGFWQGRCALDALGALVFLATD